MQLSRLESRPPTQETFTDILGTNYIAPAFPCLDGTCAELWLLRDPALPVWFFPHLWHSIPDRDNIKEEGFTVYSVLIIMARDAWQSSRKQKHVANTSHPDRKHRNFRWLPKVGIPLQAWPLVVSICLLHPMSQSLLKYYHFLMWTYMHLSSVIRWTGTASLTFSDFLPIVWIIPLL